MDLNTILDQIIEALTKGDDDKLDALNAQLESFTATQH